MDLESAIRLYKLMVAIRRFEEKLYQLFLTRSMPGTMHQYVGQEAVAVGVCAHLSDSDYITSTHRGHGHCIAKGVGLSPLMAEMFAKETGCCHGLGGSMHIADFSKGMLGANGIVGAGIPIAVGAALTCQFRNNGRVVVSFFGDGAVNEGAFHEGLNLAAVWKLPVVFVCENNLYGFSTSFDRTTLVTDISSRAGAYGMEGAKVDGMDLLTVYDTAGRLIDRARSGKGPALVECMTYRYTGHSRFEPANYRTQEEVEEWKCKDPLRTFRTWMLKNGASDVLVAATEEEIEQEIAAAVAFAESSPDPDPSAYEKYIFA